MARVNSVALATTSDEEIPLRVDRLGARVQEASNMLPIFGMIFSNIRIRCGKGVQPGEIISVRLVGE